MQQYTTADLLTLPAPITHSESLILPNLPPDEWEVGRDETPEGEFRYIVLRREIPGANSQTVQRVVVEQNPVQGYILRVAHIESNQRVFQALSAAFLLETTEGGYMWVLDPSYHLQYDGIEPAYQLIYEGHKPTHQLITHFGRVLTLPDRLMHQELCDELSNNRNGVFVHYPKVSDSI